MDNDAVAVNVARENLLLNRIEVEKSNVVNGDLVDAVTPRFDVVASNILSEVILRLLDSVRNVLTEQGIFICSGIIERNKETVVQKMTDSGFEILDIRTKEEWVAVVGESP